MLIPGCVSCDILAGITAEPGGTIHEDEFWHVGSYAGRFSVWRGFLIVKLKRHVTQLADLTPAEAAAMGPVVQRCCQALDQVLKPAKVYVCSFGDGVEHVHWWLLPRPAEMRAGMHAVFFQLDARLALARLGFQHFSLPPGEVAGIADRLREALASAENPVGV